MSDIKWVAWMRRNHMAVLKGPDYDFLSGLEYLPDGQRHDDKFHERTPWLDKPEPYDREIRERIWDEQEAREAKERTEMSEKDDGVQRLADALGEDRDRLSRALAIERRDHTALKQAIRDFGQQCVPTQRTADDHAIVKTELEILAAAQEMMCESYYHRCPEPAETDEDYMEPRDHFAAASENGMPWVTTSGNAVSPTSRAELAFAQADAMMAERAKRGSE